ncbi:hypothetical protein SAMN04487866_10173 [Thermoactinomyces sp. DSM 45891]|uniref:hypothetical protein n=1 Tax=Thermoactinomyces sp. DSM 45891 TaxID=1761907 RepID=UPI000919C8B9|nr:hypothetical protein [Thermoactinomyces sp. DSM 45891]SFW98709.1 hypothetical protein SAMN04487866_10173 [Thermoactinomyces sp. DSM 45891]
MQITDTARKFSVSTSTVHKLVKDSSDEFEGLRIQKKREHIAKAWVVIHAFIDRLQDPGLIQKTSAIVAGTLWDKIHREKELEYKGQEIDLKRRELDQKNKAPEALNVQIYLEALKSEVKEAFEQKEDEA